MVLTNLFAYLFDAAVSAIVILFFGWTLYNMPALVLGIRSLQKSGLDVDKDQLYKAELPSFSIIIPMKNEGKVARRILESLLNLDYPPEKFEIVIVENHSTDETSTICKEFVRSYPNRIKYFCPGCVEGKPAVLNYALRFAKADVVAVYDADNVPERSTLGKVAQYLRNPNVAAVQGRVCTINAEENMWTKLVYYESLLAHVYLQGKDELGLFVPLAGTCQFVRRTVLEDVGGWLDGSLTEDLELSARLIDKGYKTKFAPDISSWQENASSFGRLMKQRIRWIRGAMEVGLRYGRLLRRLERRTIDTEAFLWGYFFLVFSVVGYLLGIYSFLGSVSYGVIPNVLMQFFSVFTWATLFFLGVGLVYAVKPRKLGNVKWMPFVYVYWNLHVFVALIAIGQIILGRPRKWWKTARSGAITCRLH